MKKVMTCASRGKILEGDSEYTQMLEVGGDIANTITHATKDSMVLEFETESNEKI